MSVAILRGIGVPAAATAYRARARHFLQRYGGALGFLAIQALLLTLQLHWTRDTAGQLAWPALQRGTVLLALLYGIHRFRPLRRRPWYFLVAWSLVSLLHQLLPLLAEPAHALHLLLGVLTSICLVGLCSSVMRARLLRFDLLLWLDILIVCLGCGLFVMRYVLVVWWGQVALQPGDLAILLWPPFVRLCLLGGVLGLTLTARHRSLPLILLSLAVLVVVLGDFLWLDIYGPHVHMPSTSHDGHWQWVGWSCGTLIGAAALLPGMAYLAEPGQATYPAWGRWRLGLLFFAISSPMIILGNAPEPLLEHLNSLLLLGVALVMEASLVARCYVAIVGGHRARAELLHRAEYDALTGLPNDQSLRLPPTPSHRTRRGTAIALLSLDDFSQLNNLWGHAVGEQVLRITARVLQRYRDANTRIYRTAEAEFALQLTLDDQRSRSSVCALMRKVLSDVGRPVQIGEQRLYLSGSIGLTFNESASDRPIDEALREADIALYRARTRGNNSIAIFDSAMHDDLARRQRLAMAMRQGMWHEFNVLFQPLVRLADGGTELRQAVLRWFSQEFGEVSPRQFLPLLEEAGLSREMTAWVMTRAFIELSRAAPSLQLLITITVHDLRDAAILNLLVRLQAEYAVAPEQIMLELTESMVREDVEHVLPLLRQRGHAIVINHFGSGHSSLSSLTRLPINAVKLAVPFIAQIEHNSHQRRLCRSMIALCHDNGLKVIAKGVDTPRQRDLLQEMHCDFAQGLLYAALADHSAGSLQ